MRSVLIAAMWVVLWVEKTEAPQVIDFTGPLSSNLAEAVSAKYRFIETMWDKENSLIIKT